MGSIIRIISYIIFEISFDGGSFLVGCAVVGCIALLVLGVHNGYKETKDQKKKKNKLL